MSNLNLWLLVEKTPTAHVKAITGKSYSGNSPKPHYLVWKATETFGPCGIGWGFTVLDERVEGGPGDEKMHIARVRVWYEWQGKRGEVEHIGGTPFAGHRKDGKPFMDEDAPKKSVTDALVKALSMIGFAGDIFMGRYDDSKYLAELRKEEAEERRPEPKPAAPAPNAWEAFFARESYFIKADSGEAFTKHFTKCCEYAPNERSIAKLSEDNDGHLKSIDKKLYDACQKAMTDRMVWFSQAPAKVA